MLQVSADALREAPELRGVDRLAEEEVHSACPRREAGRVPRDLDQQTDRDVLSLRGGVEDRKDLEGRASLDPFVEDDEATARQRRGQVELHVPARPGLDYRRRGSVVGDGVHPAPAGGAEA